MFLSKGNFNHIQQVVKFDLWTICFNFILYMKYYNASMYDAFIWKIGLHQLTIAFHISHAFANEIWRLVNLGKR